MSRGDGLNFPSFTAHIPTHKASGILLYQHNINFQISESDFEDSGDPYNIKAQGYFSSLGGQFVLGFLLPRAGNVLQDIEENRS